MQNTKAFLVLIFCSVKSADSWVRATGSMESIPSSDHTPLRKAMFCSCCGPWFRLKGRARQRVNPKRAAGTSPGSTYRLTDSPIHWYIAYSLFFGTLNQNFKVFVYSNWCSDPGAKCIWHISISAKRTNCLSSVASSTAASVSGPATPAGSPCGPRRKHWEQA